MYLLVDSLIEMMDFYSDLSGKSDFIKDILLEEEKVFNRLLANSSKIIKSELNKLKSDVISPDLEFKLYDTHGISIEVALALGFKTVDSADNM